MRSGEDHPTELSTGPAARTAGDDLGAGRAEPPSPTTFTRAEWRATLSLAGVYALRFLGLYMVLPVLSLYARRLPGSTSFLTGMSLGAYGFTNMLLVLPFGVLSDKIGRKRVIALGLAIFSAGSFVAASASTIVGLLAGRALQGAGAVSSVVVALIGDVTRPEVRARAMAILGTALALSFAVGVIAGPSLAGEFGVRSLFLLTGVLSLGGMLLMVVAVPNPAHVHHYEEYEPRVRQMGPLLLQHDLLTLDLGMFMLHLALTALFVVVPILLEPLLPAYHLWRVYAPIIFLGMAIALPTMTYAERTNSVNKVLAAGITLFGSSFVLLRFASHELAGIAAGLAFFVTALGLLEPTLTTLLTRYTTRETRGTAAGVFNMSGFLGAFVGGALGGLLLEEHEALFLVLACASLFWLAAAIRLRRI
jgi:MFS family permease